MGKQTESQGTAPKCAGGVDVLDAMSLSSQEIRKAVHDDLADYLDEARAAIAELIAASKTLLEEWDRQDHGRFDGMTAKDFFAAEARFRAAIAKAGGES